MKTVSLLSCVCALALSSLVVPSAFAQSPPKQTPARSVAVKKVFPFYDIYLSLPGDGRDGFRMQYALRVPAGSPRPQMTYVLGATRAAVDVSASGQILNLPTADMLNRGRVDIGPNQPRASINMDLVPVIALSRSISVLDATNPLTDYTNAVRRAGPMAAFAPKLKGITFRGGSVGEAVFGDGRRMALPATPRGLFFQPSAPNMRSVVSLSFAMPPTTAEFTQ